MHGIKKMQLQKVIKRNNITKVLYLALETKNIYRRWNQ